VTIEARGRAAAEGLHSATRVDVEAGLSQLRRSRRRRDFGRTVLVGAVAAAAVGGGFLVMDRDGGTLPSPQPASTETGSPTPDGDWTPERIRAEGTEEVLVPTNESGPTVRRYEVRVGGERYYALELNRGGQSALFDVLGQQSWVSEFDEDSVLVQDDATIPLTDQARARLLQVDGTAVDLRRLPDLAPAAPGPGVVVVDTSDRVMAGSDDLYLVDDAAGTIQGLDAPAQVRYWGPNVDEFLWGVTDDCRVYWATAGTFNERRLDCADGGDFSYGIYADELPPGWLRPGRMVAGEQADGRREDQNFLHVSLDSGATWQRIPIGSEDTIAGVLRRLG
jgi:hypothetical protein